MSVHPHFKLLPPWSCAVAERFSLQCWFLVASPREKSWKSFCYIHGHDAAPPYSSAAISTGSLQSLALFTQLFYHPPSPVTDRHSSSPPIGPERRNAAPRLDTVNDVMLLSTGVGKKSCRQVWVDALLQEAKLDKMFLATVLFHLKLHPKHERKFYWCVDCGGKNVC